MFGMQIDPNIFTRIKHQHGWKSLARKNVVWPMVWFCIWQLSAYGELSGRVQCNHRDGSIYNTNVNAWVLLPNKHVICSENLSLELLLKEHKNSSTRHQIYLYKAEQTKILHLFNTDYNSSMIGQKCNRIVSFMSGCTNSPQNPFLFTCKLLI